MSFPDLWHPRAIRNPADVSLWGTYTGGPFKGVIHTTETDWYHSTGPTPSKTYDGFGHNFFPHATIILEDGIGRIYQHIPVNRAARALENHPGGVQTNNDSAIQCEVVWRAALAPSMPKPLLDALADWMRWVETVAGVKRRAATFASPNVNVRMAPEVWDAFDGWCGHQHVPENTHTDPGAIDINYLLGQDGSGTYPSQEEPKDVYTYEFSGGLYVTDFIIRQHIDNPSDADLGWIKARVKGHLGKVNPEFHNDLTPIDDMWALVRAIAAKLDVKV